MDVVPLSNLAKLFAHLVGNGTLSLSILKGFDFDKLEAKPLLFLRLFFTELFTHFDNEAIVTAFKRITSLQLPPSGRATEKQQQQATELQVLTLSLFLCFPLTTHYLKGLQEKIQLLFKLKGFSSIREGKEDIKDKMKLARSVLTSFGSSLSAFI